MPELSQVFLAANRAATDNVAKDDSADGARVSCQYAQRRLRIVLKDADFLIYRGTRYTLTVDKDCFSGDTGNEGIITHLISKAAKLGSLIVWIDGNTAAPVTLKFDLAPIDPLSMETGAEVRLENLQFDMSADEDPWSATLLAFQDAFHLAQSARLDNATQERLGNLYGVKEEDAARKAVEIWHAMLRRASQQQSKHEE